jgi:streptomycin 6-kinase
MAISDPIKAADSLQQYATRWKWAADGDPFRTRSSWLQPVRYQDTPAMLKIAFESEERWGGSLMAWWNGDGAIRVLLNRERLLKWVTHGPVCRRSGCWKMAQKPDR